MLRFPHEAQPNLGITGGTAKKTRDAGKKQLQRGKGTGRVSGSDGIVTNRGYLAWILGGLAK
jgi:hypothetical protein